MARPTPPSARHAKLLEAWACSKGEVVARPNDMAALNGLQAVATSIQNIAAVVR